jgi:hypothetical protein
MYLCSLGIIIQADDIKKIKIQIHYRSQNTCLYNKIQQPLWLPVYLTFFFLMERALCVSYLCTS